MPGHAVGSRDKAVNTLYLETKTSAFGSLEENARGEQKLWKHMAIFHRVSSGREDSSKDLVNIIMGISYGNIWVKGSPGGGDSG